MELWQNIIVFLYGLLALIGCVHCTYLCNKKNKAFENTNMYGLLYSAFVRADMVIFGGFFALVSIVVLLLQDWILFLLTLSVFWLVRSAGETMYWFLQQFVPRKGNEPDKFLSYKIVKNDSFLFVNQIYWQCISVITIISTIYLTNLWLKS